MRKLWKSFGYAFRGIGYNLCCERNFRIHCCAAMTMLLLSIFYHFTSLEWAVLILQIAMIFSAESLNTAVEQTDNAVTEEHSRKIRNAKDSAAAGVLFAAIGAVAVGVFLFWEPAVFKIIATFCSVWYRLIGLVLYIALWAVLIFCKKTYKRTK